MGQWIGDAYMGEILECPVCRRNFVKQLPESNYIQSSVRCSCSWCGLKWSENDLRLDPGDDDKRYQFRRSRSWDYPSSGG